MQTRSVFEKARLFLKIRKLPPKLRKPVRELFHKKLETRENAIKTLADNKFVQVLPFLDHIVKNEKKSLIRWQAIKAIARIGRLDAIPALGYALDDENKLTRKDAAVAIISFQHEKTIPFLVKMLEKKRWGAISQMAAVSLKEIGGKLEKQRPGDQHYFVQKALELVRPTTHPNAFLIILEDLKKPEYAEKDEQWWKTHIAEVKAAEPNVKIA